MYSKSGYEASKKYREKNIKRVPLDMQIEDYDRLLSFVKEQGKTMNGFIKEAIAFYTEYLSERNAQIQQNTEQQCTDTAEEKTPKSGVIDGNGSAEENKPLLGYGSPEAWLNRRREVIADIEERKKAGTYKLEY